MMAQFNELLQSSAGEGVSATICPSRNHSAEQMDELMEAWYQERQERVEAGLFLDAAQRLLKRMIKEGRITPASRRKVKNLLLAIQEGDQGS